MDYIQKAKSPVYKAAAAIKNIFHFILALVFIAQYAT